MNEMKNKLNQLVTHVKDFEIYSQKMIFKKNMETEKMIGQAKTRAYLFIYVHTMIVVQMYR